MKLSPEEITGFNSSLCCMTGRSPMKMCQEIVAVTIFDPVVSITALDGDLETIILLNMHTLNSVKFWKHRYRYGHTKHATITAHSKRCCYLYGMSLLLEEVQY
jgi:hypothetical protein